MRVIETFITYVPRENIRRSANYFVQDSSNHNGHYLSQHSHEPAHQEGFHGCWYSEGYISGTQVKAPLSSDAAETVVTREELMRAYDLVEQGYTLWFGGDCPVSNGVIIDVATKSDNRYPHVVSANGIWGEYSEIIAYRLSRSVDKDVALPAAGISVSVNSRTVTRFWKDINASVTVDEYITRATDDALETRLKKLDNITGGVWPVSDSEKLLVTADNQLIRFEPEKVITRAQWDDYVSRKIRVGDKVKIEYAGTSGEVLCVGNRTVFIRLDDGHELSTAPEYITRIPQ